MGISVGNGAGPGERRPAVQDGAGESRLEIALLGEVAVRRAGEAAALPRSRKCRALIAYLAATGRPQRRDHLCELLWEIPDDPRGALRWSLSKLRPILSEALVTDRESVAIDTRLASIDSAELRRAAERSATIGTAALEQLANGCAGTFAEGLELPRCPDFEAWLIATREDVRRARLALLGELMRRLEAEPERALPHARARVALDPLDAQARLDLLAILEATGRAEESARQRQLAVSALEEAGIAVPPALARPARGVRVPRRAAPVQQRIHFCSARDGTRIAWSAVGSGPTLVKTANWMGHLEFEWESPLLRHWLDELSRDRTLLRYDARGNGLSDRPEDLSLDAFVSDIEAVADAQEAEAFDLVGISQGALVALAFAARHPQRIRRLVLFGGFVKGWRFHEAPDVKAQWEAMITLAGVGWGQNNPAFRQMFTTLFAPRASPEQADWFNELQRASATPAEAQRLLRAIGGFDASAALGRVRVPTLVFHCRGDALVPFGNGRSLASSIPGAEFVALESDNHLPLDDEPAWTVFVERLREFLAR